LTITDDDGTVRKDWLMERRGSVDLTNGELNEKIIAPGDTVTAIGIWVPVSGGLVPKLGKKTAMMRLRPGGGATVVAQVSKRPWGMLVFALIWTGFIDGFIYVALTHLQQ
jgi:hypothetical protein